MFSFGLLSTFLSCTDLSSVVLTSSSLFLTVLWKQMADLKFQLPPNCIISCGRGIDWERVCIPTAVACAELAAASLAEGLPWQ